MSQNTFFQSSDSQTFMSHSFIPALIYGLKVSHQLLYEKQFGFQKNFSTEYAILQLVKEIYESFDENKFTLGVFIDLSKAFDTVNHNILLKKLTYFGIKRSLPQLV